MKQYTQNDNSHDNRTIHEQIIIADIYLNIVRSNNDQSALKRLREEAEEGNPWAAVYLAECYFKGISNDLQSDNKKGVRLLENLEGFPLAQYKLARWYLHENRDKKKGKELLKEAAEGGLVDAHYLLGMYYKTGTVFKHKVNKAKRHLEIAWRMGHPSALNELKELMQQTDKEN